MTQTIGMIGLGAMGHIIAKHMAKAGLTVVGNDIRDDRMKRHAATGQPTAGTPKAVADQAEIIFLSLNSARAAMDVVAGVCESDGHKNIVFETSTLAIEDKMAAHGIAQGAGKIFLDAPISGTTPMVERMMGSLYVSGDKEAYEKAKPVIETFVATNFHVGDVGKGSAMKFLANYLVYVHTVAAAECMTLGQKAGLDPAVIHEVVNKGAGQSRMMEMRGGQMVKSDYRDGDSMVFDIFKKDSSIITEFAASVESPIDLFVAARQKFISAAAQGLGHLELAAVCKSIEMSAGIDRKLVE